MKSRLVERFHTHSGHGTVIREEMKRGEKYKKYPDETENVQEKTH